MLHTRGGLVLHRALAADARRLSAVHVVAAYDGALNPSVALVAGPAGLRAFFAGLREGAAVDRVLATSTSADGRDWMPATPVTRAAGPYASNGIAAALGVDGTPLTAWGSPGEGLHLGLDPASPDGEAPAAAVAGPGIGVSSANGRVVVAWEQLAGGRIVAQPAAPPGAARPVPGSGAAQALHRVGVTGRIGGAGVYVAYTAGSNEFDGRAAVWRFGAARGTPVSSRGARHVTIAAAPEGRLWLLWDADGRIQARRSDRAAETWGRLVSVAAPARTRAIHDLAGEGSRGPLDVLALVDRRGGAGEWHQRLLPGLSLRAARLPGGRLAVAVADAGEPVPGATVSVEGSGSRRTGRLGAASFELAGRRPRITATKRGYAPVSCSRCPIR